MRSLGDRGALISPIVRDELIYEEFAKPLDKRELPLVHVPCDGALEVFTDWTRLAGHTTY